MKKVQVALVLIVTISVIFAACSKKEREKLFGIADCEEEMDSCIASHGNPEEINKYDTGDYHSWTFWYWCKGFSRTFTWGRIVDNCETSTYTFSPICSQRAINRIIINASLFKRRST